MTTSAHIGQMETIHCLSIRGIAMAIRSRPELGENPWELDYYVKGHGGVLKRTFEYFTKKEDAEAANATRVLKKRAGGLVAPSDTALSPYAERHIENLTLGRVPGQKGPIKPSTERSYRKILRIHLDPAFGWERVQLIGRDDIRALDIAMTGRGLSKATRQRTFNFLKGVLGQAVDERLIEHNPALGFRLTSAVQGEVDWEERARDGEDRKKTDKLSPLDEAGAEEYTLTAFRVYPASSRQGPQYGAQLGMALWCALRRGESYGLEWWDLDLKAAEVTVRRSLDEMGRKIITPKSESAYRTIPIRPDVVDALLRWRMVCPDRSSKAHVFPGNIGNLYWRHIRVLEKMNEARRRENREELPLFKAHGLRSVFSSVMEARGMATPTKNYYMGHSPENGSVDDIHYERPTTESLAQGAQVINGKG